MKEDVQGIPGDAAYLAERAAEEEAARKAVEAAEQMESGVK